MKERPASPLLDPREQHFRIPGPRKDLSLFLRFLPADSKPAQPPRAVLYVHGATFPSALSIAHRFDGTSWRDALCEAGFDVWGLDFYGYGESDRYPEMDKPPFESPPLCAAQDAAEQLAAAVAFILDRQDIEKLSLIAHSWGSMPASLFAGMQPALVDRLVLFAPIGRRDAQSVEATPDLSAWRIVTSEEQWNRFIEDVPAREPAVLSRKHFDAWSRLYLDSDPESRTRNPASVKVPMGPASDIGKAWRGQLAYDPAKIRSPVAIIRGEWDSLLPDADAQWLFHSFSGSPSRRDIKIGRGTHLLHFEVMRLVLWRESINFLLHDDIAQPL